MAPTSLRRPCNIKFEPLNGSYILIIPTRYYEVNIFETEHSVHFKGKKLLLMIDKILGPTIIGRLQRLLQPFLSLCILVEVQGLGIVGSAN